MPNNAMDNGFLNINPLIDTEFKQIIQNEKIPSHKTDLLIKLHENYKKIESKLIESFEQIRNLLETRQTNLLNDLNRIYKDKKLYIETNSENLSPKFDTDLIDFEFNDTVNILEHLKLSGVNTRLINSEYSNFNKIKNIHLNDLVNNLGKILTKDFEKCPNVLLNLDYSISGRGLKKCVENVEQFFSLKFKNRDGSCSPGNYSSFLDIYIIRSDVDAQLKQTNNTKPNEFQNRLFSSKKNIITKPERIDCECKLECISDGVYEVKYKLNKKGTYSLNILVNKKHIANSPYKLICSEKVNRTHEPFDSSTPIKSPSINSFKEPLDKDIKQVTRAKPVSTRLVKGSIIPAKKSSSSNLLLPNNFKKSSAHLNVPKIKKSESKSNLPSSNDNSIISSAHSNLSDSLSDPTSPRLSKSNIQNLNEIFNKEEDDFLFQIGRRGRSVSEFMNPQAVCATSESIYVTDSNNQKIDVFSHSGEFKFSMETQISSNLKLVKRPCGIVSGLDKILVVDYEFKCVNVFEENGKFVKKICQNKLLGPKGICLNKASMNQIVVADSKANAVCIFDADGKFLHKFGHQGSKNENFSGPQYVACMSNGDICVTDFYNHCIKIFDKSGNFKFSFGSNGSNQGQFNGPTGIAVDSNDNIIIVDWGNSRVQVFDKHGSFIRYIRCEINQLYGPQDLAVINNTIAIADSGNHCVKIFEYS
ncbi:unnamed protein product [Brachionus calyciflorus]|uniref:Uncharacterized protein n=1 Tax=Brachionus calyciflorus TaxID=104777 RepID=A0A813LVL4_9BILA|nr:unnamed protein product [Brachionus calyciflorus]